MLKDLNIVDVRPDSIMEMVATVNGVDLSDRSRYFERYKEGVYRVDSCPFNFGHFIEGNTTNKIVVNEYGFVGDKAHGVCDDYTQVLEYHKDLVSSEDKNYVVGLTTVERCKQESCGGWRWHKWGEYIGKQNPTTEYLYDDEKIDKVYCYSIYEIE